MALDDLDKPGWYCAALRHELRSDRPRRGTFCALPLELHTTPTGEIEARLGPRAAPVRVVDGVVFVWHGPEGVAPSFELPSLDPVGFTESTFDHLLVETGPSAIMRDLADYAHFETVHGYAGVSIDEPFCADGPRCTMGFSFDWPLVLGSPLITTRAVARCVCFGLGYQVTTVASVGGMFVTRHRVLPTPIWPGQTRVTLGIEVAVRGVPGRFPGLAAAGHRFARRAFDRDTATDAQGWQAGNAPAESGPSAPLERYASWVGQC